MSGTQIMVAAMIATLTSAPESLSEIEETTQATTLPVTTVTRSVPEPLPIETLPPLSTIRSEVIEQSGGSSSESTVARSVVIDSQELTDDSMYAGDGGSYTPGTIPGVSLELEQRFDRLAECESSGDWSINTGNGYHGGLQFYPPTWNAYGGQEFAEYAYQATREEQMQVGKRVLDGQGWGAWPACTASFGWR